MLDSAPEDHQDYLSSAIKRAHFGGSRHTHTGSLSNSDLKIITSESGEAAVQRVRIEEQITSTSG